MDRLDSTHKHGELQGARPTLDLELVREMSTKRRMI